MNNPLEKVEKILSELVAFKSFPGEPNKELILFIKNFLEELNIDVILDTHSDGKRFNLFATVGLETDNGIILSGHTDVVPASKNGWNQDPFILQKCNGRFYGRGTVDMKGFIASTLAMASTFKEQEDKLVIPIHYAFTFDEEEGTIGASQMPDFLNQLGIKPRIAIIGEPTGMLPFNGHKGGLELISEIRGSSGHASDPRNKVNAIYYASKLISYIENLSLKLSKNPKIGTPYNPPYSTLSVGRIDGGEARNIIPNLCNFDWEIRPVPNDNAFEILNIIKEYSEKVIEKEMKSIDPNSGIKFKEVAWCPSMENYSNTYAEKLIKYLWINETPSVLSFGTDGGHYQSAGIETIVFGPGKMEQMHQPNEYIEIEAIQESLNFLEKLLNFAKNPIDL